MDLNVPESQSGFPRTPVSGYSGRAKPMAATAHKQHAKHQPETVAFVAVPVDGVSYTEKGKFVAKGETKASFSEKVVTDSDMHTHHDKHASHDKHHNKHQKKHCDEEEDSSCLKYFLWGFVIFIIILLIVMAIFWWAQPDCVTKECEKTGEKQRDFCKIGLYAFVIALFLAIVIGACFYGCRR